jgi:nucleoid DNA-binding protein
MEEKEKITEEIKKLVIARIEVLPENKKISIGNFGEFSKEELINNINKNSDIGNKIIEIELEFLRAMKKGIIQ